MFLEFSSRAFDGTKFIIVLRDIETSLFERSEAGRNYETRVAAVAAAVTGISERRADVSSSKKTGAAQ
jgi:hypothetical protein